LVVDEGPQGKPTRPLFGVNGLVVPKIKKEQKKLKKGLDRADTIRDFR
jgi:hypothetical protein